jgi:hypothetical protein
MGSGFDNQVYWIISHDVTTIRNYIHGCCIYDAQKFNTLKVNKATTELP